MSNRLLKLSLIISLLGILILLFIASLPCKLVKISEISNSSISVRIQGKVISERNYNDFSVFLIDDSTGTIEAICNCRNFLNKTVEIYGKLEIYKNNYQININKIEII